MNRTPGSLKASLERARHIVLGWVAGAVNLFEVHHAATGSSPSLRAAGQDSDINVDVVPKGTGRLTESGTPVLRVGDAPTAHAASHQDGGGDEIATTTAAPGAIPKASTDGRVPDKFSRYLCFGRRLVQMTHDLGATTWTVVGSLVTMTQVSSGTPTVTAVDGTRPYESQQTGATSGNAAGRFTSASLGQRGYNAICGGGMSTGAGIALIRLWMGAATAELSGVSSPTTQHVAAFRFDTGAGDSGTWRAVTCDGASNVTVTDTGIAIAISTRYVWRIEMDASEVRFYINDALAATHTTNLPGSTTPMGEGGTTTTLTNATKRAFWDFFYWIQE